MSSQITDKDIVVYSADWCGFCHAAKTYLDQKGFAYTERDIEKKSAYAEEVYKKSGQMGIPVILIDDEVIVGFDRPKIDAALER